ncbi:phage head closure protein [Kurthia massiliensis]|uniref:phage head closure protein n=1 Tax=Kurthia massiliensis TaxID=1033739 RepID=UPI0002882773|nr:phage head closure protein [Kurthia massiliensis]
MPMTIGMMNNRVEFQKISKQTIYDEYGDAETTTVNETVLSCWCYVKQQTLKDITASVGTILESTNALVIRHTNKIDNTMTALLNGVTYQIVQIESDLQRKKFDTVIIKRKG